MGNDFNNFNMSGNPGENPNNRQDNTAANMGMQNYANNVNGMNHGAAGSMANGMNHNTAGNMANAVNHSAAGNIANGMNHSAAGNIANGMNHSAAENMANGMNHSAAGSMANGMSQNTASHMAGNSMTNAVNHNTAGNMANAVNYSSAGNMTNAVNYSAAKSMPGSTVNGMNNNINSVEEEPETSIADDLMRLDAQERRSYTDRMKDHTMSQMEYGSDPSIKKAPVVPQTPSTKANEPREDKKGKDKKEKKKVSAVKMAAFGLIFGIVAGVAFEGVHYGAEKMFGNSSRRSRETSTEEASRGNGNIVPGSIVDTSGDTTTLNYDVADIVKKTQTGIVSITIKMKTQYDFFSETYDSEMEGSGSGIIIGKSDKVLYIATNYHVIDGADTIKVGFCDGELVDAKVIGGDKDQDIAVVEVNLSDMLDSTMNAITISEIGDSDKVQVGEPAIAIGNPLGFGQSVTVGYVSAVDRTISGSDNNMTYIQTDAAINPGNSGGALINAKGQVIGINSVKYVDSKVEGMGFSIPINTAMELINDIISGNYGKSYLGISGIEIGKQYSEIYGMPEGVMIKEVEDDSPADKAGLKKGDIIVEFDGTEVYTVKELQKLIRKKEAGNKVEVVYERVDDLGSYKEYKATVTLEEDASK